MSHHRDKLFVTAPPDPNAVGRWWCDACSAWAPFCLQQTEHVWIIRWEMPA